MTELLDAIEYDADKDFYDIHSKCVYMIRCTETGRTKVGYTDNISRRFNEIQMMCPTKLEVYHLIYDDNANILEKRFHETFSAYRIHGEWFELPDTILKGVKFGDKDCYN